LAPSYKVLHSFLSLIKKLAIKNLLCLVKIVKKMKGNIVATGSVEKALNHFHDGRGREIMQSLKFDIIGLLLRRRGVLL